MIEVIYKEEKQEAKGNEGMFAIPRNIRQIGLSSEDYRIYVEDYVYTFLVRLAGADTGGENEKGHLAVLTGEAKWQSGVTYVFVRGALTVDKTEAAADHIDFSEKVWSKIHDEQELYFPGQEIVGWFFAQPELPLEITEVFKRVHLKHFGGGEKVLMLMDPAEREDAFFRYENSFLVRQPGYYLFYEKNPLMQNYMLDKNQDIQSDQTEEVPDEAVVAFRKIIRSKKKTKRDEEPEKTKANENVPQEEKTSIFSYAATACLAIAVLAVGVNFYRNYQNGYSGKQQIRTVSATIKEKDDAEVKEIPKTNVTPLPSLSGENAQSAQTAETGKNAQGTKAGAETKQKERASTDASQAEASELKKAEAEKSEEESKSGENQKENTEMSIHSVNSSDSTYESNAGTRMKNQTGSGQNDNAGQEAAGEVKEESQVYQEESDERKAKRSQEAEGQEETGNPTEQTEPGQAASGDSVHTSYVIRPGDTLYEISMKKYGSMDAISEICRLNGITEEEIIYPGQIIVLP